MSNESEPTRPEDHAPTTPGEGSSLDVEAGLAAAFRRRPASALSVLRILQARTHSILGIHVPEGEAPDQPPIRVHSDAKAMRHPGDRYQVIGEIARGGMGVVYRGLDVDLGRDVAMKVLHEEYQDNVAVLERFVEEAQIGGQLQHPGIVPVYELGLQHDERPYFAMKLVRGETLASKLGRRPDPSTDRRRFLGIFEQVCQTVAYAHDRRVVHRDLKPSNVMIGSFGEVQVVDWGFAKVLPEGGVADEAAGREQRTDRSAKSTIQTVRSGSKTGSHTLMGWVLGTPAYMPPEQADGEIDRMDARSDVFGLGAILCEILTGAPPYLHEDGDLVRQASRGNIEAAYRRLDDCGASSEVIALCKRCLSPARQARPESALHVAREVGAYLSSVEERARQAEIYAAQAKIRSRATVLVSAAAVVVLGVCGFGYLWMRSEVDRRRADAESLVASAEARLHALLGDARAAGLRAVAPWESVEAAAEQLEAIVGSEHVTGRVRRRADGLLSNAREQRATAAEAVALADRDRALSRALVEARIPRDGDFQSDSASVARFATRLDASYRRAFKSYLGGADLENTAIDRVVAELRRSEHRVEIAASLDAWAMELSKRDCAPFHERLRTLARRVDAEDPWRSRLRDLLPEPREHRDELVGLAGAAEVRTLPAISIDLLGKALSMAGARQEAIAVLTLGQDLNPSDHRGCIRLAILLNRSGRHGEAAERYRVALSLLPEVGFLRHAFGQSLFVAGRYAESERVFKELADREPDDAHWQLHLGRCSDRQHRRALAVQYFRRALKLDQDHRGVHTSLGTTLLGLRKLDEAVASLQRAIEIDKADAIAHLDLGKAYFEKKQFAKGREATRRALAIAKAANPDGASPDPVNLETRVKALSNLCVAHAELGELDEAIRCGEEALALEPGRRVTLGNLATAWRDRGILPDKARESLASRDAKAVELMAMGNALRNTKEKELAMACLRRAEELAPADPWVLHALGRALEESGALTEGLGFLRRATAVDPNHYGAYFILGLCLRKLRRLDEAKEAWLQAIRIDGDDAPALLNLGGLFAETGNAAECIRYSKRALQREPNNWQAMANLATGYRLQGDASRSIELLRKACELHPRNAGLLTYLGAWLAEAGRFEEAIDSHRRAIRIAPTLETARANLGDALRRSGRLAEAERVLREGLERFPSSVVIRRELARVCEGLGRFDDGLALLKEAIRADPNDPECHAVVAIIHAAAGRPAEAVDSFRREIALRPHRAESWMNLGTVLVRCARIDEAVRAYRRAAGLDPKSAVIQVNLGNGLSLQGHHAEALEIFERAEAALPRLAALHHFKGRTLKDMGRLDEAVESLRLATSLDPRRAGAHDDLGDALKRQRRFEESIASHREAVRLCPKEVKFHADLSTALVRSGDTDAAIRCLREGIEIHSGSARLHALLGYLWVMKGELERSESCLRRALELDPKRADTAGSLALAHVLAKQGKLEAALQTYAEALRLNPREYRTHLSMAMLYSGQGKLDLAVRACRAALEIAPDAADAHFLLGRFLFEKGDLQASVGALEKACRADPKAVNSSMMLGIVLNAMGRRKEGIAQMKRVLETVPNDVRVMTTLAMALVLGGELDEAARLGERAVALAPGDPDVHVVLGSVHRARGEDEAAIRSIRQALRIRDDHALAQQIMGELLRDVGKLHDARLHFERCLQLTDVLPQARAACLAGLGSVLRRLGKLDEARTRLEKACALNAKCDEAHRELGLTFEKLERPEEALASLQRAVEVDAEDVDNQEALGAAYESRGRKEDAIRAFGRAIAALKKQRGVTATRRERTAARIRSLQARIGSLGEKR